jgi:tetratricopeptide (TPR) repeat protein
MNVSLVRFPSIVSAGAWGPISVASGLSVPLDLERFRDHFALPAHATPPLWRFQEPPPGAELRHVVSSLRHLPTLTASLPVSDRLSFLLRLALLLDKKGLPEEAETQARLAHEQARRGGNKNDTARALIQVGDHFAERGRIEAARAVFLEALEAIEGLPDSARARLLIPLAARQFRTGDEAAREALARVTRLIEVHGPGLRTELREQLALEMIKMNELGRAQGVIEKMPAGYYRIRATCYWAAGWARTGDHETARAIFEEARAAIREGKGLNGPLYVHYALKVLGEQLLLSGPEHRAAAYEVVVETVAALRKANPGDVTYPTQAAIDMARAHRFAEAAAFIRREIRDPGQRSAALGHLAVELAKAGRFDEARDIARNERLAVTDRFHALHWLVAMQKTDQVFEEFRRFVATHEFPGRIQGLIRIGRILAERGEIGEASKAFEEAREAASTPAERIDAALERIERIALPRLSGSLSEIFFALRMAAADGDRAKSARLAAMTGFRAGGIDYALEHLSALPEEERKRVRAWAYYGASLLPKGAEAEEALAAGLQGILRGAKTPETFSVALRALRNLSPTVAGPALDRILRSHGNADPSLKNGLN